MYYLPEPAPFTPEHCVVFGINGRRIVPVVAVRKAHNKPIEKSSNHQEPCLVWTKSSWSASISSGGDPDPLPWQTGHSCQKPRPIPPLPIQVRQGYGKMSGLSIIRLSLYIWCCLDTLSNPTEGSPLVAFSVDSRPHIAILAMMIPC